MRSEIMRSDVGFGLHDPRPAGPPATAMDENGADQVPRERFGVMTVECATEFFHGCKV
jgi:hypothetical protein